MKIYKYSSLKNALLIIKSGRLLLNNPTTFNDVFDTNVIQDAKDIKRVEKIMNEFICITTMHEILLNPDISESIKKHPLFGALKAEYYATLQTLRIRPRFDGNWGFDILKKIIVSKNKQLEEKVDSQVEQFKKILSDSIEKTRSEALATCFSKVYDSLLMWAHYGDSHKGVCIEYERPSTLDFVDVIYSDKRPKAEFSELVSFIAAKTILDEDYNQVDSILINQVMRPFITKSTEWEYEKEVRCLTVPNTTLNNVVFDGNKYYYPMKKPTRIIIGCRTRGKDLNKLIDLAKKSNIGITFLKQDKDKFSLSPK